MTQMKVLIVGGGGREHTMAWKAAQSPMVSQVFVAPGNAGTAKEPGVENVPIGAEAIDELLEFAMEEDMDLTIVGPEAPLVAGIVDKFSQGGLRIFGSTQDASLLEGSKVFAKEFFERHGIPTAHSCAFTDSEKAIAYLKQVGAPIVVKADGLAAGKGVIVAHDMETAVNAVLDILDRKRFGDAGNSVVIEGLLVGEEASFIAMAGLGNIIVPLATSQDHKPRDDGGGGPNTGGMGAYSPAPVITPALHDRIMSEIVEPIVEGMARERTPYIGFLYCGLMITPNGDPKVLEINCRLGDPETQPILMRLESDLVRMCMMALSGGLVDFEPQWDPRPALGVVMASGGYPDSYDKGHVITGIESVDQMEGLKVFHAGTAEKDGCTVTAGGRVVCVTALGDDISEAQRRAYQGVSGVHWSGAFFRHDIGEKALDR